MWCCDLPSTPRVYTVMLRRVMFLPALSLTYCMCGATKIDGRRAVEIGPQEPFGEINKRGLQILNGRAANQG